MDAGGPGFQAAGAFPHRAHHAGRLASAERVRMGRDGAKRRETLPNYNEARSAISNNVRKFALGIVATRNHMSVNAQTDNRHARNHRTHVCAVIARLILLAPPERQKEVCALVLREINDIVEQVLDVNNIAPH
jgi:hypothetical protein